MSMKDLYFYKFFAVACFLKAKILFVVLAVCPVSVCLASENIRVVVADNQRTVTLKSPAGLVMDPSAGREKKIIFKSSSIGTRPVRVSSSGTFIQVNGKSYRGWIELRKKKNGLLRVVNDLDIEDYLRGVVASEIPYDWEFEALKAQAVASRTYALYQKRKAGKRAYHILASVNSQVYAGKSGERETAARAVRETEGIVITYNGQAIPAFYHSSCGGHTENASELWDLDQPYLRGVACECQRISKYGAWEKRVSRARLVAALAGRGYGVNAIDSVSINGITRAGRARELTIGSSGGTINIPAEKFRAAVGYSAIPSVFFEIELSGRDIVISGRGLGHGVGLCQWGAREMAQRGLDYQSILRHYYPGTRLMKTGNLPRRH